MTQDQLPPAFLAEPAAPDAPRWRLPGKRIAFILSSLSRTGAERQAFLLARHLKRHEGADVLLVSLGDSGGIEAMAREHGLRVVFFELRHSHGNRLAQVIDVLRFVRFLRRERIDVLLPYCMFPNVFSALTWRAGGVDACIWGQRDEGRERLERWVEWTAVHFVKCFVSNSQHATSFLIDKLGCDPNQVHVIANGVETPVARHSRDAWRNQLGVPEDAFLTAMVATLHQYKDHGTLIAAWRDVVDGLSRDGREAHLVLAGQRGSNYLTLVEQASALGLTNRVHFVGEVDDVGGLLRSLDLFVFSSYNEGVPNAVLEAMACGLMVVGTDYAGIREAVGPEVAHYLARPRDAADLASKILVAARDSDLRARAGRLVRERVTTKFALETMCDHAVELMLEQMA